MNVRGRGKRLAGAVVLAVALLLGSAYWLRPWWFGADGPVLADAGNVCMSVESGQSITIGSALRSASGGPVTIDRFVLRHAHSSRLVGALVVPTRNEGVIGADRPYPPTADMRKMIRWDQRRDLVGAEIVSTSAAGASNLLFGLAPVGEAAVWGSEGFLLDYHRGVRHWRLTGVGNLVGAVGGCDEITLWPLSGRSPRNSGESRLSSV